MGIVVADHGRTLYISDSGAQAIIRVDARTGAQTVIATGGHVTTPVGLAMVGTQQLLVGDPDAFDLAGGIIGVDLRSGAQNPLATGSGNYVNPRCLVVVPGVAVSR